MTYRADLGRVTVTGDPVRPDCYYCREVYGAGDASLYYIGKATDRAARVAIISRH